MAQLGWRQLPDGSWFNPFTGDLSGLDGAKEQAARALSERRTGKRLQGVAGLAGPGYPTPPLPQQPIVALPGRYGVQNIIDPQQNLLAVSPFELGLGDQASDAKKRYWMMALILAAAGGYVWWNSRSQKAT